MSTTEEMIKKMYDSQLKSQKEQLDTDYTKALSDLVAQQEKNQQATDANLNRTAVEAQKAAVNNAELHNAYGLSSGARAQARLAQENQLQADMTAIRTAQQAADADTERQRSLMAQEYTSAIRQAQAENDLAKAQALYAAAEEADARLLARQEAAAKLMAEAGDYSRLGALYGLSEQEIAALSGKKTEVPATVPDFVRNIWSSVNGAQPGMVPTVTTKNTEGEPEVDMNSVLALGYGPLSEERLAQLVEQGIVEEYAENGYIRFRKKAPESAFGMSW